MLACLLLDECAHNEARRVSRHLAHRELNDISEKFIGANIPFPPGPLIFNARYHILRDDPGHRKILITSIFQTTWPYPEQVITYAKDVTGKDEEDDLDINFQHDLLRKLKTKKPTPVIGPGRTQITTGGNPSKKYSPFDMPLPDFTWDDIEKAKFIPVSVQRKFPKRKVVPIQADEDPLGSFAHPYLGTGDLGPNEVRLVHLWELPHRFSLLINALQSLVKDPKHGKFQWEIVTPTGFATTISQGTAWAFQLDTISENDMRIPPQWKAINYKDKRPRTALICRIEHAGTSVYWLELECRSQESGFCALLFQPKTGKAHECIEELLLAAPPAKGVWSQKTITDDNCPSLLRWKARKHHFIKTKFTKPQNTDLDRAGSAIPKETTENASAGEANATGSAESQDIAKEQPEVIQASWVAKVFLEFVGEEMS